MSTGLNEDDYPREEFDSVSALVNHGGLPMMVTSEMSARIQDYQIDNKLTNMASVIKGQQSQKDFNYRSLSEEQLTAHGISTLGDCKQNTSDPALADHSGSNKNIQSHLVMQDQQVKDIDFDHSQRHELAEQDITQNVFVWGSNSVGQLGTKSGNFGSFEIPQSFEFHQRIQMVSCGLDHTAMVTFAKQLYVMGSNKYGQLGMGNPSDINKCTVPTLVQSLAHIQVMSVSCGARHTLSIGAEIIGDRQTSIFSWGDNSKGQIGAINDDQIVYEPRRVEFGSKTITIDKICAGSEHSFFLDTKQWHVFACGESKQGQLGLGRCHEPIQTPKEVTALQQERIVEVAAGESHTLMVNFDGRVLASGSNVTGQLGLGHTESQHEFTQIPGLLNILHVGASTHSAAIDCDGRLFKWGQSVKGVYLAPLNIASPGPNFIDQISMGFDFGIVKNRSGELYTYGVNQNGQLGLGDSESRSSLNSLISLKNQGKVKNMAAGSNFVICLVDVSRSKQTEKHFFTDNQMSVPTQKSNQPRQTSVTEFKQYDSMMLIQQQSESIMDSQVTRNQKENKVSFKKAHKVFSQQGLPLKRDSVDFGQAQSDLGTIQTTKTMQNVEGNHAIHHEQSEQNYSCNNEDSKNPVRSSQHYRNSKVIEYQNIQNDAVPPYTSSPFNAQRSVIDNIQVSREKKDRSDRPQRDTSATHNISYPNSFQYEQQVNSVCTPSSNNIDRRSNQVEEQTITQKLKLRSNFARTGHSNERNTDLNRTEQQLALSSNEYAGISALANIEIQKYSNGRSQSQLRQRAQTNKHQQMPSFSAQGVNQFRSKSSIARPSSRNSNVNQQQQVAQTMENTGQFLSNYAQKFQQKSQQMSRGHSRQPSSTVINGVQSFRVDNSQDQNCYTLQNQQVHDQSVHQTPMNESGYYQNDGQDLHMLETTQNHDQSLANQPFSDTQQIREKNFLEVQELVRRARATGEPIDQIDLTGNTMKTSSEWTGLLSNKKHNNPHSKQQKMHDNNSPQSMQYKHHQPLRNHSGPDRSDQQQNKHSYNQQEQFFNQIRSEKYLVPKEGLIEQNNQQQFKEEAFTNLHSTTSDYTDVRSPNHVVTQQYLQNQQELNSRKHNIVEIVQHLTTDTVESIEQSSNVDDSNTSRVIFESSVNNGARSLLQRVNNSQNNGYGCAQQVQYQQDKSLDYNHNQVQTATYQYQQPTNSNCRNFRQISVTPNHQQDASAMSFEPVNNLQQPHSGIFQQDQMRPIRVNKPQTRNNIQQHNQRQPNHEISARSCSRCPLCRQGQTQQNYQSLSMNGCTSKKLMIQPSVSQSTVDVQPAFCSHSTYQQASISQVLQQKSNKCRSLSRQKVSQTFEKKFKKKYKKLKQDTSRKQIEANAEAEKLKLRIHELQSMLQQREMDERTKDMKKSEGYQSLVDKYSKEVSAIQEAKLKLERIIVARESQLQAIMKDFDTQKNTIGQQQENISLFEQENFILKEQVNKLSSEIIELQKGNGEKESRLILLSEQLESKSKVSLDAENSLRHLTKTLEDLKVGFEGAKCHADAVMVDNDNLRLQNQTLNSNNELYQNQLSNLRAFVDELEGNNKELVRHIDNSNFLQANDYKTKVESILSRPAHRQSITMQHTSSFTAPLSNIQDERQDEQQHHLRQAAVSREARFLSAQQQVEQRYPHPPAHLPAMLSRSQSPIPYRNTPISADQQYVQPFRRPTSTSYDRQMLIQDQNNSKMFKPGRSVQVGTQALEQQYKTQQHCVRTKSNASAEFGDRTRQTSMGDNDESRILMSQKNSYTPPSARVRSTSQIAHMKSTSEHRYRDTYKHEQKEQMKDFEKARKIIPQVLTNVLIPRESISPSSNNNFLTSKADQLIQEVTQYHKMKEVKHAGRDPRDRLRGEVTYDKTRYRENRSKSPAEFLNQRKSQKITSKHRQSQESQNDQSHLISQGSLKVQYQKVSDVNKEQEMEIPLQNQHIQEKVSDIRNVLASTPGQSRYARYTEATAPKSPSNYLRKSSNSPSWKQRQYSAERRLVPGETLPEFNQLRLEQTNSAEPNSSQVQAVKVTSSMMRQQLYQMNESLAQLKRDRIQMNGSMQSYHADQQEQQ